MRNAIEALIGKSVVSVTDDTMTLSDGTILKFDKYNALCCTYFELTKLSTTDNIILGAEFQDDEDENGGAYKAWLHVVTEAGELNIAEGEGDAGSGYYLHGFALDVSVIPPQDS